MKLIEHFIGDDIKAKYSNTKAYLQQGAILLLKSSFVLIFALCFFTIIFIILTPQSSQKKVKPSFQVKKMNSKHMITLYSNPIMKHHICSNETIEYFGQFFTKQQFCQLEYPHFPFDIHNHHQIDVYLKGMTSNVQYLTSCLLKIHQERSVCQKFAYNSEIQIFNNLILDQLWAIQIEITLKTQNQFFGQLEILFVKQNTLVMRILKQYYFLISTSATIFLSLMLTASFVIFQISDILEKVAKSDKKFKQQ